MRLYAISLAVSGVTTLILGLIIYLRHRSARLNRLFLAFTAVIFVWNASLFFNVLASGARDAFFWVRLLHLAAALLPAIFLHLILELTETLKQKLPQLRLAYWASGFLAACCLLPWFLAGVVWRPAFQFFVAQPGPLYPVFIIGTSAIYAYSYLILMRCYRYARGVRRNQLKYFMLASIIGYAGGYTNYLINYDLKIFPLYPHGNYLIIIYVLLMSYAIIRYRLLDIDFFIKKGLVYSALIGFILAAYTLIVLLGQQIMQLYFRPHPLILPILAAAAIAFGLRPLESLFDQAAERWFFRGKYNYRQTLKDASERMSRAIDIHSLVELIVRIVSKKMAVANALLFVWNEEEDKYFLEATHNFGQGRSGEIYIEESSPIVAWLRERNDVIIREEIANFRDRVSLFQQERLALEKILEELDYFQSGILVPSAFQGKLIAILSLGPKLSGDMFSREDIELLLTISAQGAIAIRNSLATEEKLVTQARLMHSEKLSTIGTMVAGIVHEIRNPLSSIKAFASLVPSKHEDAQFLKTFEDIVPREVDRLNNLVERLLHMSKPDEKPQLIATDLNELVITTTKLLKDRMIDNNIKLVTDLRCGQPVLADEAQLTQVFINLIQNAIQAMSGQGTLTITSACVRSADDQDWVQINFQDTGCGIASADLQKLFRPFFTTKKGGTGLGLANCRQIIEDHQGKLEVRSQVSQGTCFTIYLPTEGSFESPDKAVYNRLNEISGRQRD